MTEEIKQTLVHVLDHGYVRLVDYMGDDLSIVRNARQSFDAQWRTGDDEGSDKRLLNYLWTNRHTTPFESVEFQFEVHAPIFVIRQWHRHRTWSYNELSARYTELPEEFYVPKVSTIGKQSKNNKQARDIIEGSYDPEAYAIHDMINDACEESFAQYRLLLDQGCPRELARTVLPMGTYTNMFAKVDLLNLLKFLDLRLHPHAQWEIQEYARAMLLLIENHVPNTVAVWERTRKQRADQEAAYRALMAVKPQSTFWSRMFGW